jgi:branched-chain amino acid transport system permease protein
MGVAKLKPVGEPWQGQLIRFAPYIVIGVILIILPLFLSPYVQGVLLTKILIFAIFAMSLNLILGYTGLFSLGHAAFFGVGGYTTGILITRFGVDTFWLTAPLSILMATLFAAVFGFIALRVSGLYFLMVTFALGQLLFAVVWQWFHMTGGAFGLKGIPPPNLGIPWLTFNDTSLYYFVLLFFIICYFLLYRIVNSPFGYALRGIRENEPRMRALGYNTWLYKYIAFIIAGLFAGIAGVLFAHWNMLISPRHLGITTSSLGLFYVIIGGAGTLFGPVIGSAVVIGIEYGASLYTPERWPLILGTLFVIVVMFLRGGISPHLANLWRKVVKYSYGSVKD